MGTFQRGLGGLHLMQNKYLQFYIEQKIETTIKNKTKHRHSAII